MCNLASPASPPAYLRPPARDAGRRQRGHPPPARAGPAPRGPVPHGQHQRDLRRPRTSTPRSSPTGATSIRPGRAASTTRPSGSPRASPWPCTAPTGSTWGSPASSTPTARGLTPGRRAGGVQLHQPGPARRAADRLRGRVADPEPVLRRRRDRRAGGSARLVADRAGQHRESRRAHRARAGRPRAGGDGVGSPIVTLPLPIDDPTRRCPDITLATNRAGLDPKVELRDGIARTMEYLAPRVRDRHDTHEARQRYDCRAGRSLRTDPYATLSVIMPVFNERATVAEIIRRMRAVEIPLILQMIVVDDGSSDGSDKVLGALEDSTVRVITHAENQGQGCGHPHRPGGGHRRPDPHSRCRPRVRPRRLAAPARPDPQGQGPRGLRQPLHR